MVGACRPISLANYLVQVLSLDEPTGSTKGVRLLQLAEVLRGLAPCLTSFQPVLKMPSKG